MKNITVVIPAAEDAGSITKKAVITAITTVGPTIFKTSPTRVGLQGPKGDKGDPGMSGPGIASNISRISAGVTPPLNPEENDLWIDLS